MGLVRLLDHVHGLDAGTARPVGLVVALDVLPRESRPGISRPCAKLSFDFHLGYTVAVGMAVIFLGLGALVMFGSGEQFSPKGIAFSKQLIDLYARNIGDWSRGLILFAAFRDHAQHLAHLRRRLSAGARGLYDADPAPHATVLFPRPPGLDRRRGGRGLRHRAGLSCRTFCNCSGSRRSFPLSPPPFSPESILRSCPGTTFPGNTVRVRFCGYSAGSEFSFS